MENLDSKARPGTELLMVVAISLLCYALANVLHEGVGHGGACVLGGGMPATLSTMHFDGSMAGRPDAAGRLMAAGGTLANLLAGALALFSYRHSSGAGPVRRYFLWLFATINLLQGTGYFLFSGIGGLGDWMGVIWGWPHPLAWRVGMAVLGLGAYTWVVRSMAFALAPFLGQDPALRYRRASLLMWVPYLTGALLYLGAGLLNPAGLGLVAISAASSSLGGCSGLMWGIQFLSAARPTSDPRPAERLPLSGGWLAASAVVVALFVGILGPGIRLS